MKGHLLALQNFNSLQLNHGLMEAGYVDHPSISDLESSDHGRDLSVSMTATIDAAGNLLVGKLLSYGYYIYCQQGSLYCQFTITRG